MSILTIKIDAEVFKLTGHRLVGLLSSGQLSSERFVRMLTPKDPLVLIDNTVYALTPAEFYSLQRNMVYKPLSKTAFQYLLDHIENFSLPEAQKIYLREVKEKLPGCPSCEYKRYRNGVSNIMHKFSLHLPKELLENEKIELPYSDAVYPETSDAVIDKVGDKLLDLYHSVVIERPSCLDCVEKHIMQARILANESLMGYPEHLALACGHLEEALSELPKKADILRQTLQFCLAKTNYEKRPFIPTGLLLPLLGLLRAQGDFTDNSAKTLVPEVPATLELDCTAEMVSELKELDYRNKDLLKRRLIQADMMAKHTIQQNYRELWEGMVAAAAESIAELAPKTANMLRNRRLMFVGAPELLADSGYAMDDVVSALS